MVTSEQIAKLRERSVGTVVEHRDHPGYVNPPEWPVWGRNREDPGTLLLVRLWYGDDAPEAWPHDDHLIMPASVGWVPPVGTQVHYGNHRHEPGFLAVIAFYDRDAPLPRWRVFRRGNGAFLQEEPDGDADHDGEHR